MALTDDETSKIASRLKSLDEEIWAKVSSGNFFRGSYLKSMKRILRREFSPGEIEELLSIADGGHFTVNIRDVSAVDFSADSWRGKLVEIWPGPFDFLDEAGTLLTMSLEHFSESVREEVWEKLMRIFNGTSNYRKRILRGLIRHQTSTMS